jgi:hypothetical protein
MPLVPFGLEAPARFVLETTSGVPLEPGGTRRLRFSIRNPIDQSSVPVLIPVHERLFHLFVVSHDLTYFTHAHPLLLGDGSFAIDLPLPRSGWYQMYADFLPQGGPPQLLQQSVFVPGAAVDPDTSRAQLQPDLHQKTDRELTVQLQASGGEGMIAGRPEMFRLKVINSSSGEPVTDLESFLGAPSHGLIVGETLREAFHLHPVAELSSDHGPDIMFRAVFPRPGFYKLWAQFQRRGELFLVSFVIPVVDAAGP